MKKIVLTWGLISGGVGVALLLATVGMVETVGFDKTEVLGYTTLVLSGLLVFFGIRSYRDGQAAGRLTFGRAFLVGVLIVLVSSVVYVAAWEALYFTVFNDFADKYGAHLVEKARASGASPERVEEVRRRAEEFKRLYQNPAINAALTFLEPFPIGVAAAAVSAAILRRR